jgi:uncharacterized protein
MKLQIAQADGRNLFTAYGTDYVSINAQRHDNNILVLPDRLIPEWTSARFESLTCADLEYLAQIDAEIILLGTGFQLRFLSPELLQSLISSKKGLEVMDIHSACRTYNVLVGENRKVAAALIFD